MISDQLSHLEGATRQSEPNIQIHKLGLVSETIVKALYRLRRKEYIFVFSKYDRQLVLLTRALVHSGQAI